MTRLDDLFSSTVPERVAAGFVFTEGPLWDPAGFLYVSDVDAKVHYRVYPGRPESDRIEVIRKDSGGANGATFDGDGRLVICEQDARRVVRYEGDGGITEIASRHQGLRLNRCNDIVRKSDGVLYFTDPDKKASYDAVGNALRALADHLALDPDQELDRGGLAIKIGGWHDETGDVGEVTAAMRAAGGAE